MPCFSTSLVLCAFLAMADPAPPAAPVPEVSPVVIEVSKETTFLDGPLLQDGTVDYVTAIDRINAKGVTKENNAVPLLWKAVGAHWSVEDQTRHHAAKVLGIAPPAEEDHCLTTLGDLLLIANTENAAAADEARLPRHWQATRALLSKEDLAVLERDAEQKITMYEDGLALQDKAMKAPWTAKEQASLAIWLKVNEGPVKLVEQAATRSRFYWPQQGGQDSSLLAMLLPSLGALREASRVVCARAMLRVGEGDLKGAWEDYLVVSRLARLVAQEPILISQLVARSIDAMSDPILLALLNSGKLDAAQIRAMAKQFDELGYSGDFARAVDLTERCMLLDTVGQIRRRGFRYIDQVAGDEKPLTEEQIARNIKATDMLIDSNLMLRTMNTWMDDMVAVYAKPTCKERLEAATAMSERLSKLSAKRQRSMVAMVAAALLLPPEHRRKVATEQISHILLSLLMPALNSMIKHDETARMRREMLQVAFALAQYRADHKTYPAALADLSPKYMAKVPVDRFDEKPLRYQRTEDGYLLYSIGADMKDDGGNDDKPSPADVVIRLPIKTE